MCVCVFRLVGSREVEGAGGDEAEGEEGSVRGVPANCVKLGGAHEVGDVVARRDKDAELVRERRGHRGAEPRRERERAGDDADGGDGVGGGERDGEERRGARLAEPGHGRELPRREVVLHLVHVAAEEDDGGGDAYEDGGDADAERERGARRGAGPEREEVKGARGERAEREEAQRLAEPLVREPERRRLVHVPAHDGEAEHPHHARVGARRALAEQEPASRGERRERHHAHHCPVPHQVDHRLPLAHVHARARVPRVVREVEPQNHQARARQKHPEAPPREGARRGVRGGESNTQRHERDAVQRRLDGGEPARRAARGRRRRRRLRRRLRHLLHHPRRLRNVARNHRAYRAQRRGTAAPGAARRRRRRNGSNSSPPRSPDDALHSRRTLARRPSSDAAV
mmetsp:Transcript_12159/g.40002  ORF Transcript_12159/g.40002 Transcript_12159/m.40002 type:complete len:400 (-) Transcript_12159:173-1372(-)